MLRQQTDLKEIRFILFDACECFACMYVHVQHACLVLGGTRAISALNYRTLSSLLIILSFEKESHTRPG